MKTKIKCCTAVFIWIIAVVLTVTFIGTAAYLGLVLATAIQIGPGVEKFFTHSNDRDFLMSYGYSGALGCLAFFEIALGTGALANLLGLIGLKKKIGSLLVAWSVIGVIFCLLCVVGFCFSPGFAMSLWCALVGLLYLFLVLLLIAYPSEEDVHSQRLGSEGSKL